MSKEFSHIIPSDRLQVEDTFASYQTTQEFFDEVQTRSQLQSYCEWYYITAERHRQELKRMRGELNILRFFRRR